jgi:hypothetical protein
MYEVGEGSDRFGGKGRKAVRSTPRFRQVWCEKRKSCQKKLEVLTGLQGKEEKLSEVSSSFDRFGAKRGKAVRRSSMF